MKVPELLAEPWAMAADTFEIFVECARRGLSMEEAKASSMGLSPEALTLLMSRAGSEDDLDVREGGVAVIPVRGYLTRRSYWRGDRASYAWIGSQVETALDRGDVRRIVLEIDSAGGQVNGTDELSQLIFEARDQKPITAFVTGQAASAAYWIASSASRIVAGRTSMLGSIGVIWSFTDWSKYDERVGIQEINIVSSQSPDKHVDVTKAEGRDLVQATVNQIAGVFVADVARNRGVPEETVTSNFGRGWVLVGQPAVDAGLADSIGRFEEAITESDPDATSSGPHPAAAGTGGLDMTTVVVTDINAEWLQKNCPQVVSGLRAGLVAEADLQALATQLGEVTAAAEVAREEGATAERDRIVGIMGLSGKQIEGLTHSCSGVFDESISAWVADPNVSLDSATKQYEVLAKGYDAAMKKSGLTALSDDEKNLNAPSPESVGDAADIAASIKSAGDYAAGMRAVR